jgi:hypothetical protein
MFYRFGGGSFPVRLPSTLSHLSTAAASFFWFTQRTASHLSAALPGARFIPYDFLGILALALPRPVARPRQRRQDRTLSYPNFPSSRVIPTGFLISPPSSLFLPNPCKLQSCKFLLSCKRRRRRAGEPGSRRVRGVMTSVSRTMALLLSGAVRIAGRMMNAVASRSAAGEPR